MALIKKGFLYFSFFFMSFCLSQTTSAMSLLEGDWKVTDSIGNTRYIVKIYETSTGSLSAKIIKNHSGYKTCTRCKGKYRNKPLNNMVIMSDLMQVAGNPREYNGGKLLDIGSGKNNNVKVKITHSDLHVMGLKNKRINQLWQRVE